MRNIFLSDNFSFYFTLLFLRFEKKNCGNAEKKATSNKSNY